MEKHEAGGANSLRYAYEFLLSLNIGLATIWLKSVLSPFFLQVGLKYRMNAYLHLHPHNDIGGFIAFFLLATGLALCIFLLLRVFSRTFLAGEIVPSGAGMVSLVALPASWLYVNYALRHLPIPVAPDVYQPSLFWPLLESAAALVCSMLFLYGKWPISRSGSIIILALHWGFWGWRFFGPFFWSRPPMLAFSVVGFCSTLTWGLYVSHERAALVV